MGASRRAPRPLRERTFHARLARTLPAGRTGLLPLGDDAAALRPPPGRVAVLTTDSLVEGTHFLPDSPPRRIGRAATAVSLSDVAAKGAEPRAVLLAVLVPPGSPSAWAEAVVAGAEREAARAGAHIVGGDTKPSPVRTVVSTVVAWGWPRRLAPRTGALPGDVVVTTGVVGRGGWAEQRLRSGAARARVELLDVRPRVREGIALGRFAHAMLDTSDGLADSAQLLAEASDVAVRVEEAHLPWTSGLSRMNPTRRRSVAFFGGDYELLAALPPRTWARARSAVRAVGGRLTRIGTVERGHGAWLVGRRGAEPMPVGGWRPFEADGGAGSAVSPRAAVRHRHRGHVTFK